MWYGIEYGLEYALELRRVVVVYIELPFIDDKLVAKSGALRDFRRVRKCEPIVFIVHVSVRVTISNFFVFGVTFVDGLAF